MNFPYMIFVVIVCFYFLIDTKIRNMTSILYSNSKDVSLINNNVIIQVGEDHNIEEFYAHSDILRTCSPHFKSAFSSNRVEQRII
jgi:hypothetical protein